ncbi:hypothetical protein [Desulfosporosinus sp. Sb-LF]|uniref:hypothetical protein n=1 Tax=Desulfosporosinus sp. Sb-LF TaxID=2560027 RepID=UPI00107F4E85|nr:hypothetical protein [Desulfosporosinus sp. Sb-LF]TGE32600.1 hypothetical protein E4K68_10500 [Desulfosporosinus sp. Sb-LF]
MTDENYLIRKLEWVKYRLEMLNQIDEKLVEMRQLAEGARDNKLSGKQIKVINTRLHRCQQEVSEMDEQSRTFWLDFQ